MNKGQSLFETVLALGVIGLVLTAIVALTVKSISGSSYSKNNTLASRYAQEATEWLRNQRDTLGFSLFKANAVGSRCLKDLNWTGSAECQQVDNISGTILYRKVIFSAF